MRTSDMKQIRAVAQAAGAEVIACGTNRELRYPANNPTGYRLSYSPAGSQEVLDLGADTFPELLTAFRQRLAGGMDVVALLQRIDTLEATVARLERALVTAGISL